MLRILCSCPPLVLVWDVKHAMRMCPCPSFSSSDDDDDDDDSDSIDLLDVA